MSLLMPRGLELDDLSGPFWPKPFCVSLYSEKRKCTAFTPSTGSCEQANILPSSQGNAEKFWQSTTDEQKVKLRNGFLSLNIVHTYGDTSLSLQTQRDTAPSLLLHCTAGTQRRLSREIVSAKNTIPTTFNYYLKLNHLHWKLLKGKMYFSQSAFKISIS